MTEHQQQLLEKIKQIDDLDILNLLADGAHERTTRYCQEFTPQAKKQADRFAAEVEKLYFEAREKQGLGGIHVAVIQLD